jgi:hypothetical protein
LPGAPSRVLGICSRGLVELEEGAVLPTVVAREHEVAAGARPFLERLPGVEEDTLWVDRLLAPDERSPAASRLTERCESL